jgi:lactate dehydrogenase-like 2-hydroxyacid dehydrogenase
VASSVRKTDPSPLRIVVTRRWPAEVERDLQSRYETRLNESDEPMSVDALRAAVGEADALCPTVTDRIGADVIEAAGPRLKLIANYGVGFEHIDLAAARARGIVVTNTPGVLTDATADLAMALLLGVARRVAEGDAFVRSGQWHGWRPTQLLGAQVSGQALGLVGFGRIAQAVARRAQRGFGMRILAWSPRLDPAGPFEVPVTVCASLEALLAESDFVSLHCPSNPQTRHLIDATRLAQMRPSAFLVNTARGNVVDEAALVEALRERRIAGAGLDVYEREPALAAGLAALPNALLLPHLGSATRETRLAMGMRAVRNLDAYFAGEAPPDRVA